jgi:tRNA pseudouridine38-40 synthase
MIFRFFFELSYDGTDFFGWQKQPDQISVQETIELCLSKLFAKQKINITGCGRTDTGVHASKYFFHVDLPEKYEMNHLRYKLNGMLPASISIHRIFKVENDSHARFDAVLRTYHYFIHQKKSPFLDRYSLYFKKELDFEAMNTAASLLIGEKDFSSFAKVHTDVKTHICDVTYAAWKKLDNGQIQFTISANRFLRNMVRAIVGTLIEVGLGNVTIPEFEQIIKEKDRGKAGASAQAKGLFLADIHYKKGIVE